MRKEYGQALRKLFEKSMAAHFPDFKPEKVTSMYLFPGERPFRRHVEGVADLWVILSPSQKADEFSVEVAWSRQFRFPELSMRPSPVPPQEAFERDECSVRVGELAHGHDHWFVVEKFNDNFDLASLVDMTTKRTDDQVRERVAPAVAEAMEALRKHGLPHLDEAVRRFAASA